MNWEDEVILFIVSLIANAFSALAGGGAGLIQLPALIFLGLPFSIALATHKVASVALGVGATIRHWREDNLDLKFSLFILGCGLPGVILGASIILQVPDILATTALGLLTMGLGIYSYFSKNLGLNYTPKHRDCSGLIRGGAVIFLIGGLNGSLTSGTGLFVTLWLVYWFGLEYKRAVAYTLILVGLFWNGSGAVTLGVLGDIQWDWLPALILGSLLGGYLGAHYAIKKSSQFIKRIFEVVTVLVGLKLILG